MKVAEAVITILELEGITDAFGIPGAGINPVYKYMEKSSIQHYCMRHEEACAHAADAYYRASHRLAAALCTSGPAATNFVTGLYTANIDSIPFLAITGQANSWQLGMEPFQCVNIAEIAKTVAKKTYQILDPSSVVSVMREAFFLMRSGRPGPVLIDLPLDIQMKEIDFDPAQYAALPVNEQPADLSGFKAAAEMLQSAKKPLIIMGGGVILAECEKQLVALAESKSIPVITTYMAKGGIPENHPLNAGHAGIQVGQPLGNKVLLDSDVVLGIGCRFSDRHTGNLQVYRGDRKFIHIDIDPEQIGKVFAPDLGIVCDARQAIDALREAMEPMKPFGKDRIAQIAVWKRELERRTDYESTPIMPHRLFQEINEAFDDDTMYCVGCGNTQIWSGQLQKISTPMRYLPSGGAGTLGYEIPALFGAKVADPDHYAVSIVGDFGFTFLGEEIAVAAVYNKPLIVVILNNANLGLIRQNQKGAYQFEYGIDMPYNQDGRVDYVMVAQGLGCKAERVYSPKELRMALGRAKAANDEGRTYVIDAVCVKEQLCDMGSSIDSIKCWAPSDTKLPQ